MNYARDIGTCNESTASDSENNATKDPSLPGETSSSVESSTIWKASESVVSGFVGTSTTTSSAVEGSMSGVMGVGSTSTPQLNSAKRVGVRWVGGVVVIGFGVVFW